MWLPMGLVSIGDSFLRIGLLLKHNNVDLEGITQNIANCGDKMGLSETVYVLDNLGFRSRVEVKLPDVGLAGCYQVQSLQ